MFSEIFLKTNIQTFGGKGEEKKIRKPLFVINLSVGKF